MAGLVAPTPPGAPEVSPSWRRGFPLLGLVLLGRIGEALISPRSFKRACPQSPPRSYAFPLHTGPCWHLVRSQRRPPSRACRFLPMAAAAASRSSPASLLDVCTWGSHAHLKRNLHNVDDCAWPRRPRPPSSRTPAPMANGFTMSSRTLLHPTFSQSPSAS